MNSARRAVRLTKEISKRLGKRAVLVRTEVRDVADAIEERQQQRLAGTLVELEALLAD